jgi:hypothetical protein
MSQIKFATGNFLSFTATRSFVLGTSGMKVAKDSELEFDGSTVLYAGATYPFPQLRGALKTGWIVLTEDYEEGNPEYGVRASAQIQVRPAVAPTTGMDGSSAHQTRTVSTVAEADERVVMSSKQHAASTKEQNGFKKVAVTTSGGQEGVAVRSLKTPSHSRTELTASSAGTALREASEPAPITPGQGLTADDLLERMSEDQRDEYLAKKASIKNGLPGSDRGSAPAVVGKVKKQGVKNTEGMKVTQSVGGGTEIGDDGPVVAKIKSSDTKTTRVEDGIVFTNTNVPDRVTAPRAAAVQTPEVSPDIRLRIAQAWCPDFPSSYDFSASPKKKLARLQADFEDRPDVLRAVFAAESDEFKAQLIAEFPQAFSA